MFGRSALASTSAAASLALILLAAAGCKIQVGSPAQARPTRARQVQGRREARA
jgi:hypothetical protein